MIWLLGFREIWQRRAALIIQIIGLMIAIATLIASLQITRQAQSSYIPGAQCPELGFLAIGKHRDGSFKGGWNSAQIQALRSAIRQTESEQSVGIYLPLETRIGQLSTNVGFYGPQMMKMLCVQMREPIKGSATGAVISEEISGLLEDNTTVFNMKVIGTAVKYKGTMPRTFPESIWLPLDQGAVFGIDASTTEYRLINLWVKPDQGRSEKDALNALNAVIKNKPSLFDGLDSIVPIRNLELGAGQISRLTQSAKLLLIYGFGLIILALINLTIYHAGRSQQTSTMIKLLKSLGVPPSELTKIAMLEPLLVATLSLVLGILISQPLVVGMIQALSIHEVNAGLTVTPWIPMAICTLTIILITAIAIAFRVRHFHKRALETPGIVQRRMIVWTPWILTLQTIITIMLLVSAMQSAIGLYLNLPAEPNYQLDGLTLARFNPEKGEEITDIELQWQSAAKRFPSPGIKTAIAQNGMPIANLGSETAFVDRGGVKQEIYINRVSHDFFDVLKLPVTGGPSFPLYPNEEEKTSEAPEIIINNVLEDQLFEGVSASGVLNKITANIRSPGAPAYVVGRVAEGSAGRAVTLQNPAPPQAYLPLTRISDQTFPILFIRHPVTMTPDEAFDKTRKMRNAFSNMLVWEKPITARDAFNNVLRRERAITLVLIVLAIASTIVSALGIFSVQLLMISITRTELAICLASGASRREATLKLLARLLPAIGIGIIVAALPAWISVDLLAKMVDTTRVAGHLGFYFGIATMMVVILIMATYCVLYVNRANISEWLRHE